MAINRAKIFLFIFIFLGFYASISAQTAAQVSAQNQPRLTQRFSWSGGEYTFRYEVVFERLVNNNYSSVLREFTSRRFIEVSLPVGDYRFRIIPYDILDKPSRASEWKNFKIIPVPQPEHDPQAETELEFIPDYELETEGEIEQEHRIEPETIYEPQPEVAAVTPPVREIEPEPEAEPEPEPEEIKNPFALKPVIFNAGLFISAQFSLYGGGFNEDISLIGFGTRLNVLFALPAKTYIGPELAININPLKTEEYNLFVLAPGLNLTSIKWLLNDRIALGLKLGAMFIFHRNDGFSADNIVPVIGALFRWRITPVVLLETGFDYFHVFGSVSSGYIRPWLGAGIQL
ncbi:MAG: hypothetical protein FWB95_05820 [Treponema sp.]|nr:hypothetical protein [Treponema sp.]